MTPKHGRLELMSDRQPTVPPKVVALNDFGDEP
jgi:hypothetical protein